MKYYDPIKKQLIQISQEATSSFWDDHWDADWEDKDNNIRAQIIASKNSFISQVTQKYLRPEEGIILEGGCGRGYNVASFINDGYKCIGIDYAEKTVNLLNQHIPELDIRKGDIRNLPFSNNHFIGYWSLGVIEHFWEGYESIALEMSRVIKNKGYLFLGFPYMSPLRKIKSKLGLYNVWQKDLCQGKYPSGFYQFALNSNLVIKDFQNWGFELVDAINYGGLEGIIGDVSFIKPAVQKLYYYKAGENKYINMLVHLTRNVLDVVAKPIAGHCTLLIFKKVASDS